MASSSQQRASRTYRDALARRGVARFEVMGPSGDRGLIRDLARKLSQGGPQAERLRDEVRTALADGAPSKGGVLAALRRSPLGELALATERSDSDDRRVEL